MISRDSTYLSHINQAISKIDSYLAGVTKEAFAQHPMVRDAVLRNLEVISEASRRLSSDLKERHPNIPWTGIAGAGNVYRHEYDDVDVETVWETPTAGLVLIRDLIAFESANSKDGEEESPMPVD